MKRSIVYNTFIQPICLWDRSPDLGPIVGKFGTFEGAERRSEARRLICKKRSVHYNVSRRESVLSSPSWPSIPVIV
uniref:Uncharacterized protein n=1 Tax=Timema tahoe TaxID=61484 RepID=A0A7R9P0H2_9NEOP|nr:unnamed protein product [Timema tahoe]